MINLKEYKNLLYKIRGKTIALIYTFENENAPGFKHYDVWNSEVIIAWLTAINELKCIPYILDVKTFVSKAMNNTLPFINYAINLNAGNYDLSVAGLVPSVCSFLNIPCIPCDAVTTIVGEHKYFSNCIAENVNLNVPKEITSDDQNTTSIIKPFNLGSSCGIEKNNGYKNIDGLCQEFIKGFDVSTPLLYNPLSEEIETLPPILYIPNNKDPNWFFNSSLKDSHSGYTKNTIPLQNEVKEKFLEIANKFNIFTFCRIDSRIKCENYEELLSIKNEGVSLNHLYFLEINPTPTIKNNINFLNSINLIDKSNNFYFSINYYNDTIQDNTNLGFLLSSAILGMVKAKRCEL